MKTPLLFLTYSGTLFVTLMTLVFAASEVTEIEESSKREKAKQVGKGFGKGKSDRSFNGRGEDRFQKLLEADKNDDGLIEFNEFEELERLMALDVDQKRKLYDFLDKNGDGVLQEEEIKPSDSRLKSSISEHFRQLDLDQSGSLSWEEFSQAPVFKGKPKGGTLYVFKRLDKNSDAQIDRNELKSAMKDRFYERVDFKKFDSNGSGGLDIQEYMQLPMLSRMPPSKIESIFERVDSNADGEISGEEIKASHKGRKSSSSRHSEKSKY
ncbi:MAG: EF-hand domain-containing protein [Akkermansiaceae bacterium]